MSGEAFGQVVTDAGRRMADIVRQAMVDGHAGRWLAIRLSDGGSDGVTYGARADAVRHQVHETQCLYLKVPPGGSMSDRDATRYLEVHRQMYDAGMRLIDPDNLNRGVVPTLRRELLGGVPL